MLYVNKSMTYIGYYCCIILIVWACEILIKKLLNIFAILALKIINLILFVVIV